MVYPKRERSYLEAVRERVPVYEGKFRVTLDVSARTAPDCVRTFDESQSFAISVAPDCTASGMKTCYPPKCLPRPECQMKILPLNRQRPPEGIPLIVLIAD